MGAGRGRRTGLIVVVLILLLLVGGGAAILFLQGLGGGGGGGGGEPTPTEVPQTVSLIVAARDISRGTRMSETDVTTVEWPLSVALPPGALIRGDGVTTPGLEQVENTVARVDILNGQPVQSFMLAPAGQATQLQQGGSDAALLVPAGQVAVALEIGRVSSVAYAIRPGDHVDIMISYRFVDVDEDFQTSLPNAVGVMLVPAGIEAPGAPEIFGKESDDSPLGFGWMVVPSEVSQRPRQATQLIIDNAVVMHTGDWPLTDEVVVAATEEPPAEEAPPPAEGEAGAAATPAPPPAPDIVTLIMSRQDALVLKFSFEQGADIDFALRSALDNAVTDVTTETVSLQYLLDFYGLGEPPRLPIALDPRTDEFTNPPSGDFPVNTGGLFSFLEP